MVCHMCMVCDISLYIAYTEIYVSCIPPLILTVFSTDILHSHIAQQSASAAGLSKPRAWGALHIV